MPDDLIQNILGLIIDYVINDMGYGEDYREQTERKATVDHLKATYNTSEKWSPPLEEIPIGKLIEEIQTEAAAFGAGWDEATKHWLPSCLAKVN